MTMTSDPSSNALYRRIVLDSTPGVCRAAVEDNFHYFIVTLNHDGTNVTAIEASGPRAPWSLCCQAGEQLQKLIGQPLVSRLPLELVGIDSKQNCTHQYDLAVLALTHARRSGRREFLAKVTHKPDRQQHCYLLRDGEPIFEWNLQGSHIESADSCNGRDLRNVMVWAQQTLDDNRLEALYVLRRAILVSGGVRVNLDKFTHAGQLMARMSGGCYVFQPERAEQAQRMLGSSRTDLRSHAQLLVDFGSPLAATC